VFRNFKAAVEFLNGVAELAERENHHPDLHLVGYRNLSIELTTHAIGGLSENDFILAAKIDELPVEEYVPPKKKSE
jgi:4a-hydroxytetrahydrobiopterin dehydratase